jgi:uncharacterized protein
MKKIIVLVALFALSVTTAFAKFSTGLPNPKAYVSDFANVISQEAEDRINEKLDYTKKMTTNEVAVVTIKNLGDASIEEYGIALADEWKPGTEEADNGVIMLFAMENRKMRIEVGQGLEGKLTDVKAKRILDDVIRPEFKAENYDAGVEKGVDEVLRIINSSESATVAEQETTQSPKKGIGFWGWMVIIIIVFVILGILGAILDDGSGGTTSFDSGGGGFSGGSFTSFSSSDSSDSGSSFDGFSGGSFSGGGASGGW